MDRELGTSERARHWLRRGIGGAALVGLVVGAVWLLPGWFAPSLSRAEIETAVVDRGRVEAVLAASGTVVPAFEQVLSSPFEARVMRVLARPGTTVEAGDEILALDTAALELDLARLEDRRALKANEERQLGLALDKSLRELTGRIAAARLDAELATAEAEQSRKLKAAGLISAEALRVAEVGAKKAAIALSQLEATIESERRGTDAELASLALDLSILDKERDEARRQLGLASVRADRRGVVTWVVPEEGATVGRGAVLARVADLAAFRVEATLSDVHAARLAAGLAVSLPLDGEELAGRVESVQPAIDNGAVRFTVALADPRHPKLRQNLRLDALVVAGARPGTLRLPRRAAVHQGNRDSVFVVQGEEARRRTVRLGVSGIEHDEVLAGLAPGEEVIVSDVSAFEGIERIRLR